jgi:hypothetical protein
MSKYPKHPRTMLVNCPYKFTCQAHAIKDVKVLENYCYRNRSNKRNLTLLSRYISKELFIYIALIMTLRYGTDQWLEAL